MRHVSHATRHGAKRSRQIRSKRRSVYSKIAMGARASTALARMRRASAAPKWWKLAKSVRHAALRGGTARASSGSSNQATFGATAPVPAECAGGKRSLRVKRSARRQGTRSISGPPLPEQRSRISRLWLRRSA
jgi:hypothetical protein